MALICAFVGIAYGVISIFSILAKPQGNEEMQRIASAIQEGAVAYLARQYRAISVVGVHGIRDYARTLAYLEALEPVDGVDLLRAEEDRLQLRVRARSGDEVLRRVIGLGNALAPVGGDEPDTFRLRP